MDDDNTPDLHPGDARELPMFPLGSVIFPGDDVPLHVFEPRYREMVRHCLESDSLFGVVLIERGHEVGGGDVRSDAAVLTRIQRALPTDDGRFVLECRGVERIQVVEWLPDDPFPRATVTAWPDSAEPAGTTDETRSLVQDRVDELFEILTEIARARDLPVPDRPRLDAAPTSEQVWEFASELPLGSSDRAKVLTADTVADRLSVLASALEDVIAIARFSAMPDL